MNENIPVACTVVFKAKSVLLVQHIGAKHIEGIWGLPGGKMEGGEEAMRTAQRELQEETGLIAALDDLIPLPTVHTADVTFKDGSVRTCVMRAFLCRRWSGEIRGTVSENPQWVPLAQLDSLQLLPNVKQAIQEATKVIENRSD